MDIAAAKGVSLEAVTKAMSRASMGNVGALARLGVQTKDNQGKTLAYEQVLRNAAATMGGAATTAANTTAGKMQRLSIAFQETKEAIGARLLPVVNQLSTWFLEKGIPAVERMAARWLPVLRQGWANVQKTLKENEPQLRQIGQALAKIGEVIVKYVMPAVIKLTAVNWQMWIDAISRAVRAVTLLKDMLKGAWENAQRLWSAVGSSPLGALAGRVGDLFRAQGGPVSAGQAYVVGERGPELFLPGRSGTIVPNGRTAGTAGGGGQDIVIMLDSRVIARAQNINARAGVRVRVA
jgi:phage-related minor tail protein